MSEGLEPPRQRDWKVLLVVGVTVAMAVLVLAHANGVNGPWYWQWPWRRLSAGPWYIGMALAAVPFVVGQIVFERGGRVWAALLLVMLSTLALEVTASSLQPQPVDETRMAALVRNPFVTSYHTNALLLVAKTNVSVRELLAQYPDVLELLQGHARYKPPGLLLFYIGLLRATDDPQRAATIAAWFIALAAAGAVAGTYWFLRVYGNDRDAAFYGASFFAVTPSLVLFLPVFDQVYALVTCVLLATWGVALQKRTIAAAASFGLVLAVALFTTPLFLSLGLFLGLYTFTFVTAARSNMRIALRQAAVAMAVFVGCYGVLWLTMGFDPIGTYSTISRMHARDVVPLGRPYPAHILFDLLDFALGTAWVGFVLAAMYLVRRGRRIIDREPEHRLVLLVLLQIGVISLPGLLPGESARLWLFLMPLLMAPVGFELAQWTFKARMAVYACVIVITMIVGQNMLLLDAGPGIDGKVSTQPPLAQTP